MATSPDSVYNFIGAVDSFRQEGRNLFLDCGSAALALSVITPEIIRVRFAPQESFSSRRSWAVARPDEDWPETDFSFSEEPETLTLSTSKLKIQIRRSLCRLTILDSAGQILCEETEQGGLASSPDGKVACLKSSPPNEGYYGCGERTSLLNKRGRRYQNWTRDPYDTDFDHGPGTDNMYQAIPFFMALRPNAGGYGLYLNNTFHSVLDMDSMRNGYYSLEGRAGELDYYFIYGPDPASIVERYTAVTGRGLLPPRWALGFQQCRWSYFPDSVVMEVAKQYRERRLPADTIVLDIDYMNGFRVFTWDRQRFPDPKEMNDELARQGFKVITIVDPGVKYEPNGNYQVFNEAEQNDYLIKTAEGKLATGYVWPGLSAFPDFTRAEVRQWWGDLHKMLLDSGVRAIWNDMNEPAMSTAPFGEPGQAGQIPSDAPQGSQEERTTHAEVHNLFGYLMSRSTFEGLLRLRPDERPFVLTRSGFAGIQKYAAVWMGDNLAVWEHLEMSMPQLCNMGLSGVPFTGVDIGGFSFGSSAELFARWIELGAFYPFSRAHSAEGTPQKEPWVFGEQVEAISRKYLELRYRFMPYLYTAFWQNSQSGAPVFRPMLYHFWQDPATLELNDQVMVGEGLMLAPVYRPGLNYRSVYLPAGVWYDWWSGTRFEGSEGRVIIAAAPLDTMPIYVRGGSILSLGPVMQYTDEKSLDLLTLEIFPDEQGNATGQLYDDDGLSFAYRQGQSRLTRYECRPNGAKTVVIARHEGAYQPASRSIEIRLHRPGGSVRTTRLATDEGDWEVEV